MKLERAEWLADEAAKTQINWYRGSKKSGTVEAASIAEAFLVAEWCNDSTAEMDVELVLRDGRECSFTLEGARLSLDEVP